MRYLPLSGADRRAMMDEIGVKAVDELFVDVPKSALNAKIDLPAHKGELEVERILGAMAAKNRAPRSGQPSKSSPPARCTRAPIASATMARQATSVR